MDFAFKDADGYYEILFEKVKFSNKAITLFYIISFYISGVFVIKAKKICLPTTLIKKVSSH